MEVTVRYSLVDKNIETKVPTYATVGSSGMDLYSTIDCIIFQGETVLIPTNISVEIPSGYEIQVRSKSGLAAKAGLLVLNSPGTIDSDYRGEIIIIMHKAASGSYKISRGDKVAQMVLSKVEKIDLAYTDKLEETVRGDGKFGSTGK